jgi:hypothetical protein
MSDEHTDHAQSQRTLAWDHPVSLLMLLVPTMLFAALVQFSFAHFSWFQRFEERHGFWTVLLFGWAVTLPILFIFRRKQRIADQLQFREDLRAGRVQRMSLATRCAVMLTSLGLVVTGTLVEDGTIFLMLGGPVLLLFAVEELNIILRPGDSVLTTPRDELLAFFKARSLQVGYSIAILAMVVLCLISLFATRYLVALLPVGLTASLLVPSLFYSRLDRGAGTDE